MKEPVRAPRYKMRRRYSTPLMGLDKIRASADIAPYSSNFYTKLNKIKISQYIYVLFYNYILTNYYILYF